MSLTDDVFCRKYEWLDRDGLDYYDTFERAKAVFSRAVEEGRVSRLQKIVTRERLSLVDKYFGSTTDREYAIFTHSPIYVEITFRGCFRLHQTVACSDCRARPGNIFI